MSNTIRDFMATAATRDESIVCPACGATMGIGIEGSYHFMLTDRFRGHLDDKIQTLRSFLEGIEHTLERRNYANPLLPSNVNPYQLEESDYLRTLAARGNGNGNGDAHATAAQAAAVTLDESGQYRGTRGEFEAERFSKTFDIFTWIKNYDNFPLLSTDKPEAIYKQCRDVLIPGIEPKLPGSLLMNLVFEQSAVLEFRKRLGVTSMSFEQGGGYEAGNEVLAELLDEVCPFYSRYLRICEEVAAKEAPERGAATFQTLNSIRRARLVLALMLGHKGKASPERALLFGPAVVPGKPYNLPERAMVSVKLLKELTRSRMVLSSRNLGLDPAFVDDLLSRADQPAPPIENEPLGTAWAGEIFKLVHFTCANTVGPSQQLCGWHPKEGETHSVVLLGSPGTGKTSVLVTGLASLYSSIGAIDCFAKPDGVLARAALHALYARYVEGVVAAPTERGMKERIELTIEPIDRPFERVHFVFLDVAGEDVSSMVKEEGASPDLRRILRNANTIVFQFDLTAEPTIRDMLTRSKDSQVWNAMRENFERANQARGGRASLDQFNLLTELVNLLEKQKGAEQLGRTNFVCVVPKADLFVSNEQDERFFLTGFFKYLAETRLIVTSPYAEGEGFEGMYSLAGTGVGKSQEAICREVSDAARQYLSRIGDSFPPETEPEPKESLVDKIRKGVIEFLEQRFGASNVYFLPVSALGKDTKVLKPVEVNGDGQKAGQQKGLSLGHKPNQKLSEYVFLLPIILALKESFADLVTEPARRQAAPAFGDD